jgi:hypothetical protein
VRRIAVKMVKLFMFTIYIRTFIQAYQTILLSSCREIKDFNTSKDYQVVSLTVSFVTFLVCGGMIGLMIYQWLKSKNPDLYRTQKYFIEIFSGLRDDWRARSYNILNYGRRGVLVVLVMFFVNVNIYAMTVTFTFIQLIY